MNEINSSLYKKGNNIFDNYQREDICRMIENQTFTKYYQANKKKLVTSIGLAIKTDSMTGLYNKNYIKELINRYLLNKNSSESDCLIMIDVKDFKNINDNYGHIKGDYVIESLASSLKLIFRNDDFMGRIGGDEFIVFMKNASYEQASSKIFKLKEIIRNIHIDAGIKNCIEINYGIAQTKIHGNNYSELFQYADVQMYMDKLKNKEEEKIFFEKNSFNDIDSVVLEAYQLFSHNTFEEGLNKILNKLFISLGLYSIYIVEKLDKEINLLQGYGREHDLRSIFGNYHNINEDEIIYHDRRGLEFVMINIVDNYYLAILNIKDIKLYKILEKIDNIVDVIRSFHKIKINGYN